MNGIILAAGFSRRMGDNKLLMEYKGKTIIESVIETIKKSKVTNLILVAKDDKIIEIGKKLNIKTVKNHKAEIGQSQSIKLGITHGNLNYDYMFFCGDQPFINEFTINKLIDYSKENKERIIIPKFRGKVGNPVIFPKAYKEELLNISGDTGGRVIIKSKKEKVLYVEVDDPLFIQDIDNLEEYNKYIKKNN